MPEFGLPSLGTAVDRHAAYALIRDERGHFLAVRAKGRLFLPGGGCEPGESWEEALEREIREETGHGLKRATHRFSAIQHFVAEGVVYRMVAAFYAVELGPMQSGDSEEELSWCDPVESDEQWYHACHAWAVRREADVSSPSGCGER